jgi:hypothetical protein
MLIQRDLRFNFGSVCLGLQPGSAAKIIAGPDRMEADRLVRFLLLKNRH